MCLAVPMKLVSRDAEVGTTELNGVRRKVSLVLVPEANVGDHLLIHAGFAIGRIDEAEARETLALLEDLAAHGDGE